MKPNEMSFCIHPISEVDYGDYDSSDDEYKDLNIITFCPVDYWQKHKHLPDYSFAKEVCEDDSLLPEGYMWYICVEETQWCSKKSISEISSELSALGFVENLEMKKFLTYCYTGEYN